MRPTMPTLGAVLHNLAIVRLSLNDPTDAERLTARGIEHQLIALKADPRRVQPRSLLVKQYHQRGVVMMASQRFAEAETAYRAALGYVQRLVDDFPAVPEHRLQLVRQFSNWASLLDSLKRHAEGG